jgi:Cyclin
MDGGAAVAPGADCAPTGRDGAAAGGGPSQRISGSPQRVGGSCQGVGEEPCSAGWWASSGAEPSCPCCLPSVDGTWFFAGHPGEKAASHQDFCQLGEPAAASCVANDMAAPSDAKHPATAPAPAPTARPRTASGVSAPAEVVAVAPGGPHTFSAPAEAVSQEAPVASADWKAGFSEDELLFAQEMGSICQKLYGGAPEVRVEHTSPLFAFQSATVPVIQIGDYTRRLVRNMRLSQEAVVISIVFIDRVLKVCPGSIFGPFVIHRLLLTSLVLAAKYHDDEIAVNTWYARLGGLEAKELAGLEARFCALLGWTLFVPADTFRTYAAAAFPHRAALWAGCLSPTPAPISPRLRAPAAPLGSSRLKPPVPAARWAPPEPDRAPAPPGAAGAVAPAPASDAFQHVAGNPEAFRCSDSSAFQNRSLLAPTARALVAAPGSGPLDSRGGATTAGSVPALARPSASAASCAPAPIREPESERQAMPVAEPALAHRFPHRTDPAADTRALAKPMALCEPAREALVPAASPGERPPLACGGATRPLATPANSPSGSRWARAWFQTWPRALSHTLPRAPRPLPFRRDGRWAARSGPGASRKRKLTAIVDPPHARIRKLAPFPCRSQGDGCARLAVMAAPWGGHHGVGGASARTRGNHSRALRFQSLQMAVLALAGGDKSGPAPTAPSARAADATAWIPGAAGCKRARVRAGSPGRAALVGAVSSGGL